LSEATEDREIILAAGALRARVAARGASLRGVWRELEGGQHEDIATGYSGAANKAAGQGDILIPFPGRVREGRYTFEGVEYQMDRNDRESPAAIHGFLREQEWTVDSVSGTAATFSTDLLPQQHTGYPFSLHVTVHYTLAEDGLTCKFEIRNSGDISAPVAAGFHPYFTVGSEHIDGDTLQVPMESILEFEGLLPTGNVLPVVGTPFDFRQPRTIGEVKINTCFLNPIRDADGKVRVTLTSPDGKRSLSVWMDESFDYVVLYSGDPMPDWFRRRSLAIEAMTCASDAFNHPDWGLVALEPGATFTGSWGISV
jgi:aldose 1-epimerase